MRKLILSMHTSLDGFVAGPNGEMDWILVDDELFDYANRLTEQADMALYGRATYQLMESYWPTAGDKPNASKHDIEHSSWYKKTKKVVVSNSMKGKNIENIRIIADNLQEEIQKLKQEPGKNIQIFGSLSAAHSLMQHNLIDEYWLFVNPILLGTGIPLFKKISDKINLKLVETHACGSGVLVAHYIKKIRNHLRILFHTK